MDPTLINVEAARILGGLNGLESVLNIVKRLNFYPMWRLITDWYIGTLSDLRRRIIILYEFGAAQSPLLSYLGYISYYLVLFTQIYTTVSRSRTVPRSVRRAIQPLHHQYFCQMLFLQRRLRSRCTRWLPRDIWDMIGDYAYADLRIFLRHITLLHGNSTLRRYNQVYQQCYYGICNSMRLRGRIR